MEAAADSIVLVAGLRPGTLAALMMVAIATAGLVVSVVMGWRGRPEAWSLVGLFGAGVFASATVFVCVPSRIALHRSGIQIAYGPLRFERAWRDVSDLSFRDGQLGTWVSFRDRRAVAGPIVAARWPGLLLPRIGGETRRIAMQIDAWRVAAAR